MPMYIIAVDGNPTFCYDAIANTKYACPVPATDLLLPPGARMDVLVQLNQGSYGLWTKEVDTGTSPSNLGDPNCEQQLGWVWANESSSLQPFEFSNLTSAVQVNRPTYAALAAEYAVEGPCTTDNNNQSQPTTGPTVIPFAQTLQQTASSQFSIRSDRAAYQMDHADMTIEGLPCIAQWHVTNTTDSSSVGETHVFTFIKSTSCWKTSRFADRTVRRQRTASSTATPSWCRGTHRSH